MCCGVGCLGRGAWALASLRSLSIGGGWFSWSGNAAHCGRGFGRDIASLAWTVGNDTNGWDDATLRLIRSCGGVCGARGLSGHNERKGREGSRDFITTLLLEFVPHIYGLFFCASAISCSKTGTNGVEESVRAADAGWFEGIAVGASDGEAVASCHTGREFNSFIGFSLGSYEGRGSQEEAEDSRGGVHFVLIRL